MVFGRYPCFDIVCDLRAIDPMNGSVAQTQAKRLIAFLLQGLSFQNMKPIELTHSHHVLHTPLVPKRHAANLVGQHAGTFGAKDWLAGFDLEIIPEALLLWYVWRRGSSTSLQQVSKPIRWQRGSCRASTGFNQVNEGYIPVVKGDLWENLPFTLDFQHENRHLARGFPII